MPDRVHRIPNWHGPVSRSRPSISGPQPTDCGRKSGPDGPRRNAGSRHKPGCLITSSARASSTAEKYLQQKKTRDILDQALMIWLVAALSLSHRPACRATGNAIQLDRPNPGAVAAAGDLRGVAEFLPRAAG